MKDRFTEESRGKTSVIRENPLITAEKPSVIARKRRFTEEMKSGFQRGEQFSCFQTVTPQRVRLVYKKILAIV